MCHPGIQNEAGELACSNLLGHRTPGIIAL